jgi:tRNA (guanine37-N1)-methyltransferase
MKIDILTLFPNMFKGPFDDSIIKKALKNNLVQIKLHNLRKWSQDKHQTVDDRPYGGGKGMILMIEPVYHALQDLKKKNSRVILLSPQGQVFSQALAQKLSKQKHLILIAGHYEGFDERIRTHLIDQELSIGDYILTGGELPAMVLVDSLVRLLPGVLDAEATQNESFSTNTLDYPQYTRPENFKDWAVPPLLLSGNHAEIAKWRKKQALKKTKLLRPDLL